MYLKDLLQGLLIIITLLWALSGFGLFIAIAALSDGDYIVAKIFSFIFLLQGVVVLTYNKIKW